MRLLKKLAMVVAAAVVAVTPFQVQAEELPDLKKTGSITVTVKDKDAPVSGEELTLVQVAAAISKNDDPDAKGYDPTDRGYAFMCTDAFADEKDLVNGLTADNAADTAKQIYAYAQTNKIAGTSQEVDVDGKVQFSNLAAGLYLIWNSKTPAGYQTIDPFLVTVPVKNVDAQGNVSFVYDVDASPKMETASEFVPLVVADPPVQKLITGDSPSSVSRFLFTLKRLDSSSPLPVNDNGHVVSIDGDTMTLYADGAEKVEIGTFTFTEEGDYYYEVSEVNNGIGSYTYDDTVYWYKYEVRRDETGKKLTCSRLLVKKGGAEGEQEYDGDNADNTVVFKFTNTFHKKTVTTVKNSSDNTKKLLPHTGQLWWPVMVLAAAGVLCVVAGLVIGSRKRGSDAQ